MNTRRTRGPLLVAGALVALGGIALLGAGGGLSARGHSVAATVPRLEGSTLFVPGLTSVLDFDWYEDELYLLDPLDYRVTMLHRDSAGAWQRTGRFGRYGGGPGELMRPTGIARLRNPPRIAIVDQARLHLYDTTGTYLESLPVGVACLMPLPRVAAGARGIFIHGDCMRRSSAGDTMYAVLFWSADGKDYREVVRDPRLSADGGFGSAFGARTAFTPGLSHHLFGSGISNCMWRITEADLPTAAVLCSIQQDEFALRLRPATRRSLERRPRSPASELPKTHAWYEQGIPGARDLLLRPFQEDSLVLRSVAGQEDLAVVPFRQLVGCRAGGCMYAASDEAGMHLRMISSARLQDAARGAGTATPTTSTSAPLHETARR